MDRNGTHSSSPAGFTLWLEALWRFSRPHTIIATSLQVMVCAAFAFGAGFHDDTALFVLNLLAMTGAGLGLNIYVVGINQLTDISIDRVNKPELPLVSGLLTPSGAKALVLGGGALSLVASLYLGLSWALGASLILLLGTLYSCEPFRLKQHAVWSGLVIAICRGVIFNVTCYATWLSLYPGTAVMDTSRMIAFCSFMFSFVLSIGIFKDLPDYEGDKSHAILTYAVRFGLRRSFWAGVALLSASYSAIIALNLSRWGIAQRSPFLILMILSLVTLLGSAASVRKYEKSEFVRFYRLIWGLFYLGLGAFSSYAIL